MGVYNIQCERSLRTLVQLIETSNFELKNTHNSLKTINLQNLFTEYSDNTGNVLKFSDIKDFLFCSIFPN